MNKALHRVAALVFILGLGVTNSPADVRFVAGKGPHGRSGHVSDFAHVRLSGELRHNDVVALREASRHALGDSTVLLHANGEPALLVFLSSSGGDLDSATEMGRFLRHLNAHTWVDGECSSACVFVLMAGVDRAIPIGSQVGFHRPYYSPHYFSSLTPEAARNKYEILVGNLRKYVEEMGFSDAILSTMLGISSHSVLYVSRTQIQQWNLHGTDPAYEEWTRATRLNRMSSDRVRRLDEYLECLNVGRAETECSPALK